MSYLKVDNLFTKLKLSDITLDNEIQSRQQLNQEVITEYAEAMKQGATFPPVVVFYDDSKYWLADGFHRVSAKKSIDECMIVAEVQSGSRRDAILFAAGANSAYGLQRSNADKRRAVEKLLHDSEWNKWSDNAIAKKCGVSNTFVGKLRHQLPSTFNGWKSTSRRGTDGRVINTKNIGLNGKISRMKPSPYQESKQRRINDSKSPNTNSIAIEIY